MTFNAESAWNIKGSDAEARKVVKNKIPSIFLQTPSILSCSKHAFVIANKNLPYCFDVTATTNNSKNYD